MTRNPMTNKPMTTNIELQNTKEDDLSSKMKTEIHSEMNSEQNNELKSENELSSEKDTISLTPDALIETQKLSALPGHLDKEVLRVYLEGKGCDGFTYGVSFDNQSDNDLVFPQAGDNYSIDLVCDPDSYNFLKGAVITFVDDERGRGYLVENPRHKRYRGKFYKKKVWQKRLEEKRQSMENQLS